MSLSLNFIKIWFFVAEWFPNYNLSFLSLIFNAIMHLWSLQRWIIAEWLYFFLKTRYQNVRIKLSVSAWRMLSNPSNELLDPKSLKLGFTILRSNRINGLKTLSMGHGNLYEQLRYCWILVSLVGGVKIHFYVKPNLCYVMLNFDNKHWNSSIIFGEWEKYELFI